MKKTNRKKLGNKGFSLVELIVVIAIMAILVGVLAPSLLKNVEKSREAKDITNLNTVYTAIQTTYANEAAASKAPADTSWTNLDTAISGTDPFYTELRDNLGSSTVPTFSSKAAKATDAHIYFKVTSAGKVTVRISTDSGTTAKAGTYNTFEIE